MLNFKNVKISIENPTIRQKFIIVTCNLLLWIIVKLFKNDDEKIKKEITEIVTEAYKVL